MRLSSWPKTKFASDNEGNKRKNSANNSPASSPPPKRVQLLSSIPLEDAIGESSKAMDQETVPDSSDENPEKKIDELKKTISNLTEDHENVVGVMQNKYDELKVDMEKVKKENTKGKNELKVIKEENNKLIWSLENCNLIRIKLRLK